MLKNFEKNFSKFSKSKFSISCANGTDALYLALKCLNLPKNSEVIVPAMTWISTVLSIINNNLKPVLVDVDKNDALISLKETKKKLIKKQKLYYQLICMEMLLILVQLKKYRKKKDFYN